MVHQLTREGNLLVEAHGPAVLQHDAYAVCDRAMLGPMGSHTTKICGVSFDFGHVLVGLDFQELAARLDELQPAVSPSVLQQAVPHAYRVHDEAIARGAGHEQAWRNLMRVLVRAGCPAASPSALDHAVDTLWRMQRTHNLWRNVPDDAKHLLECLSKAGVPMVITSNSEGRLAELVADLGIAKYFAAILDSGQLGVSKPDPAIFELAARQLGVPRQAMAHVGDSETADIAGAKGAGVFAIRFDLFVRGRELEASQADARAATYRELLAILSRILGLCG